MKQYLYLLLALSAGLLACKKNELGELRMFTPTGTVTIRPSMSSVFLQWKQSINTDTASTSYTVEVSKDSLFASADFTFQTDSASITLYDSTLSVRTLYFARIKANGNNGRVDSRWLHSQRFAITGEQLMFAVRDPELFDNKVTLRWKTAPDITKITLAHGTTVPVDYPVSATEVADSMKTITGLLPNTRYAVELYAGNRSRGYIYFTTLPAVAYSFTITPADNIATVIDTCSDGAVIGLNPGVYGLGTQSAYIIRNKSVTLRGTAGDAAGTKIHFKEFTLKGDSAGLALYALELDGAVNTANYVINLTGLNADNEKAAFKNVVIENCRIHDYTNCLLRGNRGAAAATHSIRTIRLRNTRVYNNTMGANYTEFTIDKLNFIRLEISNCTFYKVGQSIVSCGTALTAAVTPQVYIDHNTFNSFGFNNSRVLFDGNANTVTFTITNNIFANTPRVGAAYGDAFRASATSGVTYSYNNTFNFYSSGTTALNLPNGTNIAKAGNRNINLGWDANTTAFALPANSELRTAGSGGSAIGDLNWTY